MSDAPVVTMRQLLEAGVHFGHQTKRWDPKMKPYIFGQRNGIYIIDLHKSLAGIESAFAFVRDTVASGGNILFVGTKKQAQDAVRSEAERAGQPFVNFRWLGGMITNFQTIHQRILYMKELEVMESSGEMENLPKKEALRLRREREKLERNLGGIRNLSKPPSAVFVIDTKKEQIAVTEANKAKIPVVAVVDTNCDPTPITYMIPGNDDAIRSSALMSRVIADAVIEGKMMRAAGIRPDTGDDARSDELSASGGLVDAEAAAQAASEEPASDTGSDADSETDSEGAKDGD
ncbi:MAG: 30S ribosomal protein S2 [Acidobacteria bacterium]|nr:MAG: 30S ribosomal protein S2 [Acidobacteriota bacterium]